MKHDSGCALQAPGRAAAPKEVGVQTANSGGITENGAPLDDAGVKEADPVKRRPEDPNSRGLRSGGSSIITVR